MRKKPVSSNQKAPIITTSDGSYGQEKEIEDYYSDNEDEDHDHNAIL